VHDLLTFLSDLPPLLVYVVAALLVTAETAVIFGLFLPAEATLVLVGFLAYLGTLRLGPALAVMIAAAAAGDALGFRAGRRYGPRIRASRLGGRVGEARWDRAHSMVHRMGGRGVLGARWLAFVRTLVPRLAGSAGMPYRRFAPWNLVGGGSWVAASILVGYLAGTSYERVSDLLGRATGAVLILLASVLAIVLVGRWLGRNPDPARALLARAAAVPPLRWVRQRYGVLFFLLAMQIGPGWALLINLIAGLGLLFVAGLALGWLVRAVVEYSGLTVVDTAITSWMEQHRASDVDSFAMAVVSVFRGPFLIAAVALVALVLAWRRRAWRRDLVSLLGSAGAFLPLVILAVVDEWLLADAAGGEPGRAFLPTQSTIVTASLCTLAWLIGRNVRWLWAVTAWTAAAVGVVTVVGARVYLGWTYASEAVTSVLLGVLWTAVFMVAWATRDRAAGRAGGGRAGPDGDRTGPGDGGAGPGGGRTRPGGGRTGPGDGGAGPGGGPRARRDGKAGTVTGVAVPGSRPAAEESPAAEPAG
jgi:undecaprenyl-diphosphatase